MRFARVSHLIDEYSVPYTPSVRVSVPSQSSQSGLARSGVQRLHYLNVDDDGDDAVLNSFQVQSPGRVAGVGEGPALSEVSYPVTEVSYPATEVSYPATEVSYPVTEVSYPATEVSYPATEVSYPVTTEVSVAGENHQLTEARAFTEENAITENPPLAEEDSLTDNQLSDRPFTEDHRAEITPIREEDSPEDAEPQDSLSPPVEPHAENTPRPDASELSLPLQTVSGEQDSTPIPLAPVPQADSIANDPQEDSPIQPVSATHPASPPLGTESASTLPPLPERPDALHQISLDFLSAHSWSTTPTRYDSVYREESATSRGRTSDLDNFESSSSSRCSSPYGAQLLEGNTSVFFADTRDSISLARDRNVRCVAAPPEPMEEPMEPMEEPMEELGVAGDERSMGNLSHSSFVFEGTEGDACLNEGGNDEVDSCGSHSVSLENGNSPVLDE